MVSTPEFRFAQVVDTVLSKKLIGSDAAALMSEICNEYRSQHYAPPSAAAVSKSIDMCRTCDSALSNPSPGIWNYQDSDVLFVVSNISDVKDKIPIFGTLLKNAGFNSAFCGMVGLTKCAFKAVSNTNIEACSSFVYDQVNVSRPKAIVVLGADPYKLFAVNESNHKSVVGSSWWYGTYKIFSGHSLGLLDNRVDTAEYIDLIKSVYKFTYGNQPEIISLD
jgi:hypothetical protein